ncbi:MAG: restriction endonuclease [Burkholderiaceae bacterium]
MGSLTIGTIYRYSSSFPVDVSEIDGLPNLLFHTNTAGQNKALLEAGINPIRAVKIDSDLRIPAILISSSTHKQGSKDTPWQDEFDVDNGYIKYYGDNKSLGDPSKAPGNSKILDQLILHRSNSEVKRLKAVPFIFFKSVKVDDRVKGNRIFQGVGLLRSAELVTQFQKDIGYFTNYVFEFDIVDMREDFEIFSWDWISNRRSTKSSDIETLQAAPKSWKAWIKHGEIIRDKLIRRVHKKIFVAKSDQLPAAGSREEKCLSEIYGFYDGKKHNFELLASKVVANIIRQDGGSYQEGWITQGSGDGGIDFVGRIDLGQGFSKVEIVVLGQAKCQVYSEATNALHLARTVARLKRGWVGAFVTTSYFSDKSQQEISEDSYPLITVNGLKLAIETLKLVELTGSTSVSNFLKELDDTFLEYVQKKKPEDILKR